ncbi:hypothetical protein ETH_00005545 [Eimeria tenella]|uniref:Xrn1 N-terminal domain-containing protein n=1 Tax=Eimeria tenella TaxID=5802 RepID=U6L0P8_EIMTE|nr:hypothetical protein ETH_00005545 [Eimeria tenella]CDJ43776.1 hypothetical protein ETH_00005545 [Eimeria tenella]|eukprot:XP_013234525.1 hypothetical protein ETH_00005545 [Eimeria tenella]
MGVPTFYRWLSCRFPRVVVDVLDQQQQHSSSSSSSAAATESAAAQQQQQREAESSGQPPEDDPTQQTQQPADQQQQQQEQQQQQQQQQEQQQQQQVDCDCLYLDMNGIIHPCCHSEDGSSPPSESEMHQAIFLYIDRLVEIAQPRLLLYLAIGK